jgi:LysR family transcriptional regulator, glycine cleavage system transcriptional activator
MTRGFSSLRAFEVVVRHETFRAAADELHVTSAAVIQQVKALESFVGRKLLQRHSRGYSLTPEGVAGLRHLRTGFEELRAAVDAMTSSGRRIVRVSAVPSLSAEWLVSRLHTFRDGHPDIDVLVEPTGQLIDLERFRIDLGIRYGTTGRYPRLISERLFIDELFPVCSPSLLKGRRRLREPSDLEGLPLIHTDWSSEMGHWPGCSDWFRTAGVPDLFTKKGLRFSDGALVIQAALNGHGVALGSKALALDHLASGRLVRPFQLSLVTDFAYYIVCAKKRAEEPDLVAFRRWVISEAHQAFRCVLGTAPLGEPRRRAGLA